MINQHQATAARLSTENIADKFLAEFRLKHANTESLINSSYRLRHKVYCEELALEKVRPNFLEHDEFDALSKTMLVQPQGSTLTAGSVRVICADSHNDILPIEKYCDAEGLFKTLHPSNFPRNTVCEISRLVVDPLFRGARAEKGAAELTEQNTNSVKTFTNMRNNPMVAISLYLSAAAIASVTNRHHTFVMIKPTLARSMRMMGIRFKKVGDTSEKLDGRAPYYAHVKGFEATLLPEFQPLYYFIRNTIITNEFG